MGNSLFRNRYWYYKSVYDDYGMRELRYSFGLSSIIFLPYYWWGVHYNRELEVNQSHYNYVTDYAPRRNRLTHSLLYEEFETILEKWQDLEDEYEEKGEEMLKELKDN